MKIFHILAVSLVLATSAWASRPTDLIKRYCLEEITKVIEDTESQKLLKKLSPLFQKVTIPVADIPDPETARQLEKEDPEALYYGYDGPPDYKKARLAAYALLMNAERRSLEPDATGPCSVLMMLYANGQGVERNIDLALFFAAVAGGASVDVRERLTHLSALKEECSTPTDLNFCEQAMSGPMMAHCLGITHALQDGADRQKMAAITTSWKAEEKTALQALQKAAKNYFALRALNEIDISGTARAMLIMEEEQDQKKAFLELLMRLNEKNYPVFSPLGFKKADASLNKAYQKLIFRIKHATESQRYRFLADKSALKETQRLWIAYRDAWVSFAKIKYPNLSETALKTLLTEKRTTELEELLEGNS